MNIEEMRQALKKQELEKANKRRATQIALEAKTRKAFHIPNRKQRRAQQAKDKGK
jgi:hypothetical protein